MITYVKNAAEKKAKIDDLRTMIAKFKPKIETETPEPAKTETEAPKPAQAPEESVSPPKHRSSAATVLMFNSKSKNGVPPGQGNSLSVVPTRCDKELENRWVLVIPQTSTPSCSNTVIGARCCPTSTRLANRLCFAVRSTPASSTFGTG